MLWESRPRTCRLLYMYNLIKWLSTYYALDMDRCICAAGCTPAQGQVVKTARTAKLIGTHSRRNVLLKASIFTGASFLGHAHSGLAEPVLHLALYSDEQNGFTFLRPDKWTKVEKDGAAVLFEQPEKKSNNVGVVVNPVRISSLLEFGTPQDVANKLVQAEKNKESTKSVHLLEVGSRQTNGGIPIYEIEYLLDSTRGAKRINCGVTIARRKLYILNLAVDDSDNVINHAISQAIVSSFNII